MLYCECDDYVDNMAKIDYCCCVSFNYEVPYDGKFFKFCPWCGTELKEWAEGNA